MRTVVHHYEIQCLIQYRHDAYRATLSFYLTHSTTILYIFLSASETNKCLTKWRREVYNDNYLLVTEITMSCVTVTCTTSTEQSIERTSKPRSSIGKPKGATIPGRVFTLTIAPNTATLRVTGSLRIALVVLRRQFGFGARITSH